MPPYPPIWLRLQLLILLVIPATIIPAQQPHSPLRESHQQYLQHKENTLAHFDWISLGPVVNSARVESVQVDPTSPGTIYAAFGSGGLWKTTNNGVSWNSIFDGKASYGIGDIALAPSNPKIIYVGTGESLKKARNFTIPGTGVYRSDNGGKTWRHLGLNDSWHIGEIAVHPTDPDVVLVAVLGHFWSTNKNRGLYLTQDGGQTWTQVLYVNEKTGANDVVWSQANPNHVYASLWENHPEVAGQQSSVHFSVDGGKNWKKCEEGLPTGEQIGRIGLACSTTNPLKAYALIDNREFAESAAAQVYRTLDGGKTWNRTHAADLKFLSRIGWYFADIYVNPQNDEEIYALGVRLAHSQDGGKTFQYLSGNVSHTQPSAASGLHLDQCELWIHPSNPKHLVLGNDGGLYQSFDGGQNWKHFNNIATGEFYDIEIDQTVPYRIFAGAQDDATVFGPPRELDPARQIDAWKYLWIDPWNGGDGCVTRVDPKDPQTVYYSAQEGAFRRKDMRTNRSRPIRPRFTKEFLKKNPNAQLKFQFVAPMIISPHASHRLYLAGNYVFRSEDRGDHWRVISPDLSKPQATAKQSNAFAAIAESPIEEGRLYAGSEKGTVWVSEDNGLSWHDRSRGLPVAYIRSIFPSQHSKSRVYVAMSGLNYDDFDCHLYCSDDSGVNWKRISSNLPNEPVNVVIEDHLFENLLLAGTFRGVYFSVDRGESWYLLGTNLPTCSVADLAVHKKTGDLIAGTHGRGVYKICLTPLHETLKQGLMGSQEDQIFPVPVARHPYVSDTRPGLNFRDFEKVTFSFWLSDAGKVKFEVTPVPNNLEKEQKTAPVFSFSMDGKRGLNQYRWDLVTGMTDSPNPYFIRYKNHLPKGNYQLVMTTQSAQTITREFKVIDAEEPAK